LYSLVLSSFLSLPLSRPCIFPSSSSCPFSSCLCEGLSIVLSRLLGLGLVLVLSLCCLHACLALPCLVLSCLILCCLILFCLVLLSCLVLFCLFACPLTCLLCLSLCLLSLSLSLHVSVCLSGTSPAVGLSSRERTSVCLVLACLMCLSRRQSDETRQVQASTRLVLVLGVSKSCQDNSKTPRQH
jgi:hypothetical protein